MRKPCRRSNKSSSISFGWDLWDLPASVHIPGNSFSVSSNRLWTSLILGSVSLVASVIGGVGLAICDISKNLGVRAAGSHDNKLYNIVLPVLGNHEMIIGFTSGF